MHMCDPVFLCMEVPLSATVDGWGLAVGDGVMGDWRRSFGVGGGGSGGRVGGAEVQATVFQAIILHGVATGHVLPQLLELGRAQACCNTHVHTYIYIHIHNQAQSNPSDYILLLPNKKRVGSSGAGCKECKVSRPTFKLVTKA